MKHTVLHMVGKHPDTGLPPPPVYIIELLLKYIREDYSSSVLVWLERQDRDTLKKSQSRMCADNKVHGVGVA